MKLNLPGLSQDKWHFLGLMVHAGRIHPIAARFVQRECKLPCSIDWHNNRRVARAVLDHQVGHRHGPAACTQQCAAEVDLRVCHNRR